MQPLNAPDVVFALVGLGDYTHGVDPFLNRVPYILSTFIGLFKSCMVIDQIHQM